jgi:alginate O-acetyltransferase complex protein AlgI
MYSLREIFSYVENKPLLFTQYLFWVFFAGLMLVYTFIYKHNVVRRRLLLAFSLFFYYKCGGYFFLLLLLSTLMDYGLGRLIYSGKTQAMRKLFVTCSVILNLGLLSYFKYYQFYLDLVNNIFHTNFKAFNILANWSNNVAGSHFDIWTVLLPVGISFYTFQSLSYTIDIYRKKIEPVNNILDFAFFVTYFPQLVAGPIVRAAEFLPQIKKNYSLTNEDFGRAGYLILGGLIKKMVISDYISLNFVDRVFDNPLLYSGFENLMAVYGYTIQIYCDFSGYTDIAIGLSLLLGYHLPINFNSPYKAINISDFWRRWHISLSTWLRDYLYIPLGGNRKGKARTYINLFLTMLLGGLWHGAHFRFIIWGGLHGLALAFHKGWSSIRGNKKAFELSKTSKAIGGIITFHFVAFCWIFFRAANMDVASQVISQIGLHFQPELIVKVLEGYSTVFVLMLTAYFIHIWPMRWKLALKEFFIRLPLGIKAVVIFFVVVLLYQVTSSAIQPFIYFQF